VLFVAWVGEAPVWFDPVLYEGHWRSPFAVLGFLLVPLPGIRLYAWHLMLVAVLLAAFASGGAFRRRTSTTYVAVGVSAVSLAVTLAWGLVQGGSPWVAYYQLWRFVVALAVAMIVVAAARSPYDLRALGRTVVLAALVRGTLASYFYFFHVRGKVTPIPPHMTTHEDSMLFVAAIVVTLSWALTRRRWTTWAAAALACGHLSLAMALNNRRLAWIELIAALAFLYALLPPRGVRRKLTRWAFAVSPLLLVYVAVGWGRPEPVFAPLKAFATAGSNADASSLARLEENRNLIYTIGTRGNPLLGTGWGRRYVERTSVYTPGLVGWQLYSAMPHNSLLGLVAFSGLVGLLGTWGIMPVAAFAGTRGAAAAASPVDRAAGIAAVAVLPAYAAQCYGDIGLQMLTCCLILGAAVGAAGSVYTRTPATLARRPQRHGPSPASPAAPARSAVRRAGRAYRAA